MNVIRRSCSTPNNVTMVVDARPSGPGLCGLCRRPEVVDARLPATVRSSVSKGPFEPSVSIEHANSAAGAASEHPESPTVRRVHPAMPSAARADPSTHHQEWTR